MSDVKIFKCKDCAHMCVNKMLLSNSGDFPDMCIAERHINNGIVNWQYQESEPELIDKTEVIERLEEIMNGYDDDIPYHLSELIRVIKEGYLDA